MKKLIGLIAVSVILFGCGGAGSSDNTETSGGTDTSDETQNSGGSGVTVGESGGSEEIDHSNTGPRIVKIKSTTQGSDIIYYSELIYDSNNRLKKQVSTDVNGIVLLTVDLTYNESNNLIKIKTSQDLETRFYYQDNKLYKRIDARSSSGIIGAKHEVLEWDGDKPTLVSGEYYDADGVTITGTSTHENTFTGNELTHVVLKGIHRGIAGAPIVYNTTYNLNSPSTDYFIGSGNYHVDPASVTTNALIVQTTVQSAGASSNTVYIPTYNAGLLKSLETIKTDEDGVSYYSLEEFEYSR